jgi:hypothetical protein
MARDVVAGEEALNRRTAEEKTLSSKPPSD